MDVIKTLKINRTFIFTSCVYTGIYYNNMETYRYAPRNKEVNVNESDGETANSNIKVLTCKTKHITNYVIVIARSIFSEL